jgi:hypothetical protein
VDHRLAHALGDGERREVRVGLLQGQVVDGAGGFEDDFCVGVAQELRDLGALEVPQRQRRAEPRRWRGVVCRGEQAAHVADVRQAHHAAVAEVRVLVVVVGQELQDRHDGACVAVATDVERGVVAHPRTAVPQQLQHRLVRRRHLCLPEHLGRLRADLLVAIAEQGDDAVERPRRLARHLPQRPLRVDPRELVLAAHGHVRQRLRRAPAAVGQLELCRLPHALVGVRQQGDQLRLAAIAHALLDEPLRLQHDRARRRLGVEDADDAPFLLLVEVAHPVGDVRAAVDAELDVGRHEPLDELVAIDQLEAGALGLHRERPHGAVRAGAEVGEEEVVLVALGQARAGVVRAAAGAAGDVRDRRDHVRRGVLLLEVGQPLGQPRAGRLGGLDVLVADAPASVAAFYDVNPPRRVAVVAVVVASEQVAVVVEHQLLRVAQARGEDLDV